MKCFIVLLLFVHCYFLDEETQDKECGHYKLAKRLSERNKEEILIHQSDAATRNLKEEDWKPIRIHLDYSQIDNNSNFKQADIEALKEKIMPTTIKVFESIVKVKQFKEKLKLNAEKCDDIQIPADKYKEGEGEGVDADLVIFVKIDDTNFFLDNHIEAAAIHCLQDSTTKRPVAGFIIFKPDLLVKDSAAVDYIIWLAIHEITHIFVFNDALYEDFIDKDMKPFGIDNIIKSTVLPSKKKMKMISSPKVV
jgi:hypothetical protein